MDKGRGRKLLPAKTHPLLSVLPQLPAHVLVQVGVGVARGQTHSRAGAPDCRSWKTRRSSKGVTAHSTSLGFTYDYVVVNAHSGD